MKQKLIFSLILLPFLMHAQIYKERDVIASGGSFSSSGNLQMDFTLAELSVKLLSAGDIILMQGFNQPSGFYVSIPEDKPVEDIRIYPNPVMDKLHIFIPSDISSCEIAIHDPTGRLMDARRYLIGNPDQKQQVIECGHYPPGIYFIRVVNQSGKNESNYKVIKTN